MRIRRRSSEEPVVLPSLDRLSGLIERVVELVDAVGEGKGAPDAPAPEPVVEAPQRLRAEPAAERGWVAFVSSAHGYRLVEGPGATPARGDRVELDEGAFRVVKVAGSPLPGDPRRCAYVVGEEPRAEGRTSDA